MNHRSLRRLTGPTRLLLALLCFAPVAQARDVAIAIVDDGPEARALLPTPVLLDELEALIGDEFSIRIVAGESRHGDWTRSGASAALDRQFADPEIDLVVTTGLLGSAAAAERPQLEKPVIGLLVADIELQNFPHDDGRSGKRNFVYLYDYSGLSGELESLLGLADFKHVALIADPQWLAALPELDALLPVLSATLGAQLTIVAAETDPAATVAAIPPSVDAVYVSPLLRYSLDDVARLSQGLIARKLPSYSSMGGSEVELGLMSTAAGSTVDDVVIARRVAILVQRILLGRDAAALRVGFESHGRLLLNMQTARAIEFSPRWETLQDASLLNRMAPDAAPAVTLIKAMEMALEANLDLRVADYETKISRDDVRLARSALLPQLGVSATTVQVSEDLAETGLFVERRTDVSLVGSQVLYSEDARAGHRIANLLAAFSDETYKAATLDTLAAAAASYLTVLRAEALEAVTRSNVEVTRTNLDLARVRARTGYSGRAEVLRWESEIARDRQELAAAEAAREQAATELNRVLSRGQGGALATTEQGLDQTIDFLESAGFQKYVSNPGNWSIFQDFYAEAALENAPEIAGFETLVRAQDRQVRADRRRFYVPEVSLQVLANHNINGSGIGSTAFESALDDDTWSVGVQFTLPLFSGGALRSELNRSRHRLRQLELEREVVRENVEARIRSALQRFGGSYPALDLSRQAADAASRNLELVTDQYSRGAVSVTDLIDAQEAALQARLSAADARYAFLIDFVAVQRAAGDFQLLLRPGRTADWMNQVEHFFNQRQTTGQ